MISRKHRFQGHRSLDYIYKKGRTGKADAISIKFMPSKREDYRLAVVVSKKVSKSAVKRNRIRRRVFEQFRVLRKEHGEPIRYDIIITVFRDNLAEMPAPDLAKNVRKLASLLGIKS
jgi:ribonuclease P protein component